MTRIVTSLVSNSPAAIPVLRWRTTNMALLDCTSQYDQYRPGQRPEVASELPYQATESPLTRDAQDL